jgi:hypothetical protein
MRAYEALHHACNVARGTLGVSKDNAIRLFLRERLILSLLACLSRNLSWCLKLEATLDLIHFD